MRYDNHRGGSKRKRGKGLSRKARITNINLLKGACHICDTVLVISDSDLSLSRSDQEEEEKNEEPHCLKVCCRLQ